MSNNLRTRNGMPFNFVNGLKVRGMDIESLIPGIEGIPEAGSKYQFAGNGSNKGFTLPVTPYNKDAVDVYVKQLYVHPDDYTLVGDTVTLTEAPPAVVAGETYNVVIKVSLTTLNGYVNANRVSFEGENLDDILEKGKPLANYSNLRAYAGAATQVRITDPGIAGFFYYDAADTTSADNGGTIIVSLNGKRWKRVYSDAVNVKWFGAAGDGIADDTNAIQAAINYCKEKLTGVLGTNNGGQATLFFSQGMYKITTSLSCNGANGLYLQGSGIRTSTLVFTGTNSTLFTYVSYIDCKFTDLTVTTGTIAFSGGLPQVVVPVTRTNTAFQFNGALGGTNFEFNNVAFWSFDAVFATTSSTVNDDNHIHRHCRFYNNNIVWKNTNTQAVVWTFNECKVFSTQQRVFENPGSDLRVIGGDYINPGTFFYAELTSLGLDARFQDVRFENYQNIDPSASPRFIDIPGGSHTNIVFDRCTARGGGTLTGKISGTLAGQFYVLVRDCVGFGGTWDVTVASSNGGVTSTLVFDGCGNGTPIVNQILSGGIGNKPLNLKYKNHFVSGGSSTIERNFIGALYTQSQALATTTFTDVFRFEAAALSVTTLAKACPVFIPAPYISQLVGVEIEWTNNTANTVVVDVWESSSKVTKLATVTTSSASGLYQNIEVPLSGILARHQINASSPALYVEFTAAANAGACKANVGLRFRQVSF